MSSMKVAEFRAVLSAHPETKMQWMLPVEVEYEEGTISQYPVAGVEVTPAGLLFYLRTKHTACLAPEKCGVDGGGCC